MPGVDIHSYTFTATDQLLLDTNILLFVFGPQKPNDRRSAVYSNAYKKMLEANSKLYVDVLIMSEFINRYTRLEMGFLRTHKDYKNFRKSEDFTPVARDIASNVRRISKVTTRTNCAFEECPLDVIISEFVVGRIDFNDQMILHLCRTMNLTLVTDDGDCNSQDVKILTANSRLLGNPDAIL